MTITEEDRTNALGLFNSAECYRQAADILGTEHARALRFDQPIRYLFYHAIELYLKAFLRADFPLDKVESFRHEIAPEPAGHGLPLSKCEAYNRVYEQSCGSS